MSSRFDSKTPKEWKNYRYLKIGNKQSRRGVMSFFNQSCHPYGIWIFVSHFLQSFHPFGIADHWIKIKLMIYNILTVQSLGGKNKPTSRFLFLIALSYLGEGRVRVHATTKRRNTGEDHRSGHQVVFHTRVQRRERG